MALQLFRSDFPHCFRSLPRHWNEQKQDDPGIRQPEDDVHGLPGNDPEKKSGNIRLSRRLKFFWWKTTGETPLGTVYIYICIYVSVCVIVHLFLYVDRTKNQPNFLDAILHSSTLCTRKTSSAQSFRKPRRSTVKISREKKPDVSGHSRISVFTRFLP